MTYCSTEEWMAVRRLHQQIGKKKKRIVVHSETLRNAKLKKCSMSGWEKKGMCLRCNLSLLEASLCFFGAGGQVLIVGNRNLCAFGVEKPPPVAAGGGLASRLLSDELGQEGEWSVSGGEEAETSRFLGLLGRLLMKRVFLDLMANEDAVADILGDSLILDLPLGAIIECL
ncbi:hypothetical protein SAY87_017955 [Trapa incisa]|uniref:Uncharacterized protein n=1 Tax=Trapa incisa TaxID=236973 RepID=A0AAN7QWJ5_9MYRT|nr:hypothetical protein SAY87_017955 [Trapa incisa]